MQPGEDDGGRDRGEQVAAITRCNSMLQPPTSEKIHIGSGLVSGERSKVRAGTNSFEPTMKAKMPVTVSAGAAIGRQTRGQALQARRVVDAGGFLVLGRDGGQE